MLISVFPTFSEVCIWKHSVWRTRSPLPLGPPKEMGHTTLCRYAQNGGVGPREGTGTGPKFGCLWEFRLANVYKSIGLISPLKFPCKSPVRNVLSYPCMAWSQQWTLLLGRLLQWLQCWSLLDGRALLNRESRKRYIISAKCGYPILLSNADRIPYISTNLITNIGALYTKHVT